MSDGEAGADPAGAQGTYVVQERFRSSGAVGADEDVGAVAVGVGDLGQSRVQDGDVVRGGVGAGVARPQHTGQGLAGVVQEAQHRVVAEAALVGGRCLLLLRVAGDQGGVDVQDQVGQVAAARAGSGYAVPGLGCLQPGDLPGRGPGCPQCCQSGGVDAGQQAPGGRGGGDRAEHLTLVTQQSQVRDRLAAVGEHHPQVDRDPPGIVAGAPWPQSAQRVGEGGGQADGIGEIGQQAGPGVADHSTTVGGDDKPGA